MADGSLSQFYSEKGLYLFKWYSKVLTSETNIRTPSVNLSGHGSNNQTNDNGNKFL